MFLITGHGGSSEFSRPAWFRPCTVRPCQWPPRGCIVSIRPSPALFVERRRAPPSAVIGRVRSALRFVRASRLWPSLPTVVFVVRVAPELGCRVSAVAPRRILFISVVEWRVVRVVSSTRLLATFGLPLPVVFPLLRSSSLPFGNPCPIFARVSIHLAPLPGTRRWSGVDFIVRRMESSCVCNGLYRAGLTAIGQGDRYGSACLGTVSDSAADSLLHFAHLRGGLVERDVEEGRLP